MKKLTLALFVLFTAFSVFPQTFTQDKNNLSGGLGMNFIDGKSYFAFRFTPEFSLSKVGVGLDLNLEVGTDGKIRKENFNETSDYLSIIRYVRYGNKKEPVFVKVGAIDGYTLGHGSIMYLYNNSPSFDARKIGLVVDIEFDKWGFESIYSDFSQGGIFGARGYTKPLRFTPLASVPVIGNLEVGATFASDFNKYAGVRSGITNASGEFEAVVDDKSVSVIGFDMGLPLFTTSFANSMLYLDFVKFANAGSGTSAGVIFNLGAGGMLSASVKLERRLNGSEFIPSYFNALYELERFKFISAANTVVSKYNALKASTTSDNGYFGGLGVNVLNLLTVNGSYQRLDKDAKSGLLHISADLVPKDLPFIARAGYDKVNIQSESDMFKLDDRSVLYAETGYKPYSWMLVTMVYQWTYTPQRDGSDNIIGFVPQKKVEPRVYFIYPF